MTPHHIRTVQFIWTRVLSVKEAASQIFCECLRHDARSLACLLRGDLRQRGAKYIMDRYTGRAGFWITGNEVVRIQDGRGLVMSAQYGSVWITQAGSSKDVFIADGGSFLIERDGLTLVSLGGPETAVVVTLMPSVRANGPALHDSIIAASFESGRVRRGSQSSHSGVDPRDRLPAHLYWDGVRRAA